MAHPQVFEGVHLVDDLAEKGRGGIDGNQVHVELVHLVSKSLFVEMTLNFGLEVVVSDHATDVFFQVH